MEDLVGYAFAIGAVYVAYKWFSAPKTQRPPPGPTLGFTPKRVTQDMVTQVQTMFPDQPYDNIHYDLLKSGSVEMTCNKILEQGFLPPPPQVYFTLYPTQAPPTPAAPQPTSLPSIPASSSNATSKPSLIDRYGLKERAETDSSPIPTPPPAGWETTTEKREASLRERKAAMVLAARQKLLEQERQAAASAQS
ncbi:hypothetical protein M407DRAFT_246500 [Tulasnella calospora MUT 4182]|uniref:CUE domain-containing protein n=1 Tax=Tulasnella calospora MUT 4182 TaxID=1051891 RepID=A0A0C3KAF4_9AGAM|nr:hypothetical protein M407DRAFT_246500 [Tulasnella calospora MUT 4182]